MRSLLYKLQDTYEISKSSRDLFCATYQYLSRARVRNSPTTRNRDEMRPGLANTVLWGTVRGYYSVYRLFLAMCSTRQDLLLICISYFLESTIRFLDLLCLELAREKNW